MKNLFKSKTNLSHAVFVFLIAFSAFLAFEPLFNSLQQSAAQEFASAIFGTIFAAVITMVLLSKQTETEEEKSRSEKVFEEKLGLYNLAIDTLQGIFKKVDASNKIRIQRADIVDLEFLLAKLIMVADEKTIHEFRLIYQNISKNFSPKTGLLNLTSTDKHTIFRFADYCREELGLSNKNIEKEILEDIVLSGELFYHLEEEDSLSVEIINTLKDIYGYIVFEMSIPLQQITFLANGFEVYGKSTSKPPFVKCEVTEEGLFIALTNQNHIMRYFSFDSNNTLHIKPTERSKFLEDFTNLKRELQLSKER